MLKIKNPETEEFEELLEDGNTYALEQAFAIFTTPYHTLSFVTDTHVIFLHELEIKKCFDIFTTSFRKTWDKYIEEKVWAEDYAESFAKRVRREMGIKKNENPFWFSPLIEKGRDCYLDEYKGQKKPKEDKKVNELVRLYWCDPNKKESGYIISKEPSQLSRNRSNVVLEGHSEQISVYNDEIIEVLMSTYGTSLDALIANDRYDKAYYIANIGGAEYDYKGHKLIVADQNAVFIGEKEVGKNNPHLLLELESMVGIKSQSKILIQKIDDDDELETVGIRYTMKDAREHVDIITHSNCGK